MRTCSPGTAGCQRDGKPGTLEYAIATCLRNISAAAQAGGLTNPLAGKTDAWWTSMRSWREMHSDEESWQLVALVRHLPRLRLEEMDLLSLGFAGRDCGRPSPLWRGPS